MLKTFDISIKKKRLALNPNDILFNLSLQPDVLSLLYLKLRLFDLIELIV